MVFSTPVFLFYFLVLTLLVYYLVPRKLRNVVILISSLIFYYWGEQTYVAIMFLSTAIDFTHGMLVEHFKGKGQIKYAKLAVASSMFFNLLLLLFFKYWDFLATSFQALGLTFMPVLHIHLPIGISFYTTVTGKYEFGMLSLADAATMDGVYPGLSAVSTKQCLPYVNMMTMNTSEIVLVEVSNSGDVAAVKAALQSRIDAQVAGGAWYPSAIEVWQNNSRIVSNGNYVMMVVNPDCDAIVSDFNALF